MQKIWLVALVALGACVEEPVDGRTAFAADCAGCHGNDAMGGGPLARDLTTAPPDLTTIAARNGGVFPRNAVMSTIDGLNRGAHFSAAMPEFGAGDMGDTVIVEQDGIGTPVPARLLALTEYLEDIQR
ncbi:c-type cytochrome [Yoonia sp. SS1-5]|uniref:Cytochrome c n=1 Tax=Yoonia rhodophyticola TaxID=3137370 RepID=A0AAN0MM70_9RHOB